jgi:hypothetical protein
MPQPFRAVVPPPIATEKILLLRSQVLALAFSVDQVQEILLKAQVIVQAQRSITNYRDNDVPVVFGRKSCPPIADITLGIIKIPEVKGGLVAIACSDIPTLIAISPQDWQTLEIDTSPWRSDCKVYNFNGLTYAHIISILKSS